MTCLVVLGAGEDQLAAFDAARRRGLRSVGVDMRADAPGAALADEFLHISTRDGRAIAAALDGRPVAGVIAPAGDAAQPTVRMLARRLGLAPIVSEAAARCSANKGAFRALVAGLGLPNYRTEQHVGARALARAAERIGCPLMVKPADASGSKGVTLVTSPAAVPAAIAHACRHSVSGEVIVEQFVEGRHLAVECFLVADEPALLVISERTTTGPPGMITVTHRAPARLSAAERRAVEAAVSRVAAGVGLHEGPLNLDVVFGHDGLPYVIEMGARLGGNGMPQLVWLATGVDTVAAAVAHACGERFDVRPRFSRSAVLHILHARAGGTLVRYRGLDVIARSPEVVRHELFVAPGSHVQPYLRAADKLGYVLLAGPSRARLDKRLAAIEHAFGIDLDPAVSPPEVHSHAQA